MKPATIARTMLILAAAAAVALLLPRRGRSVLGNEASGVYHSPDCRLIGSSTTLRRFASRSAAEAEGFRPCGVCVH